MNLQISPIGIGVIAVYSLVVLFSIVWSLSRLLRNWRRKWLLIAPLALPLLAAPWAEEVWIASRFEDVCKGAGVHVYRRVEVEGFYSDVGGGGGLVESDGYRFAEYKRSYGNKIERVEKPSNTLQFVSLDHPTARYHFRYADPKQEVQMGWKLEKWETIVVDSEKGELLGRDTHFKRYPNVAEGMLLRLVGQSQTICEGPAPKPPALRYPLYHYVLIPIKQ